MGADGGITLYDLSKFEQKFGKDFSDKFRSIICDSQTYINILKGEEYLTEYRGDNIYCDNLKRRIENTVEISKWGDHLEPFDVLHIKDNGLTWEQVVEMVQYLNSECNLTYWEVWT